MQKVTLMVDGYKRKMQPIPYRLRPPHEDIMNNFHPAHPTKVLFGPMGPGWPSWRGQIPSDARILITYVAAAGAQRPVGPSDPSELAGLTLFEFGGIEPKPHLRDPDGRRPSLHRAERIDFLLAVGGGSVLDGTKFIAAAAHYDPARDPGTSSRPWVARWPSAIPLEAQRADPAGHRFRDEHGRRHHPQEQRRQAALLALRDAALRRARPRAHPYPARPSGGQRVVDAFIHTLEQYLTYLVDAKGAGPLRRRAAADPGGRRPKALVEPENYDVRANIMWSATLAPERPDRCRVPAGLGHPHAGPRITALHGLDHAQTLAVVLPALLNAKRDQKRAKLLQYAERVWDLRSGSEAERIDGAIAATRDFGADGDQDLAAGLRGRRPYRRPAGQARRARHDQPGEHGDIDPGPELAYL